MDVHEDEIEGYHSVNEALSAGEKIHRISIPWHRRHDARLAALITGARARNIAVVFQRPSPGSKAPLEIRASVPPFAYADLAAVRGHVRSAQRALVVVLDHLEDPQNVGAVMRNAEGAGADAVVIPERRAASITAAVRRAAAGAAAHLRIARVPNIASALMVLKDEGCWVSGLSLDPRAPAYDRVEYAQRCVLVVGSEGKGLSRLVAERCDVLVRIPLEGRVASLNAASAAAIVLFEVARQRRLSRGQARL